MSLAWKKESQFDKSVKDFYLEQKKLDNFEMVYLETARIMANSWMYFVINGESDLLEKQELLIRKQLSQYHEILKLEFDRPSLCIFFETTGFLSYELVTGHYFDNGEWIKLDDLDLTIKSDFQAKNISEISTIIDQCIKVLK